MNEKGGGPVTMEESARRVVTEFLQSVVAVDDMAFFGPQVAALGASSGGARVPRARPGAKPKKHRLSALTKPSVTADVPEQALDAKKLIDGFADHGLVCAVMRPARDEPVINRVVTVARRSDIVILDWELNGDRGAVAKRIIKRVVLDESGGSLRSSHPRLRLVAIYSGAIDLHSITKQVKTLLASLKGLPSVSEDGPFAIVAGLVRIVVFAKPTTRLDGEDAGLAELRKRQVRADELPTRLIEEFSALTMGLVPHVALASLAALRRNTHRILGRLRANLDPGYLWHRATQSHPADAEEHLVQLVGSELRSVLDDERVGRWADITAIEQWLNHQNVVDYAPAFKATSPITAPDVLLLLRKGAVGGGKEEPDRNKDVRDKFKQMCVDKDPHKKKDIAAFASTPDEAHLSNERFAALMLLRHRYDSPAPRLELGAVISCIEKPRPARRPKKLESKPGEESGDPAAVKPATTATKEVAKPVHRTYWLCIQPLCDSVRLKGDVPFPLLPLEIPDDKNPRFDMLLPDDAGGYLRLRVAKKPRRLKLEDFSVQPAESDCVIAQQRGRRKHFEFLSTSGKWYRWIAELKADQALRIVQHVSNEFSRVGLTESEWLRLWATR